MIATIPHRLGGDCFCEQCEATCPKAPEKIYAYARNVGGIRVEAHLSSAEAIEARRKLQGDGMGDALSSGHTYVREDVVAERIAAAVKRLEDRIEALRDGLERAKRKSNDAAYDQILKTLDANDAAVEAE